MADELIDILDENNNPLNIQKMKSEAHKKGLWHRAVHIMVYNSKKEILLQLRAKDKGFYPDKWDISCAGHVGAGEDVLDAAMREIKEELGLNAKKEDLKFIRVQKVIHKFNNMINCEFFYIYFLKFDGNIKNLKIQKEELQKIKFFSVNEFEKEFKVNKDKFLPHKDYWEKFIDELKNSNSLE